jgi:hypothetical protein
MIQSKNMAKHGIKAVQDNSFVSSRQSLVSSSNNYAEKGLSGNRKLTV